VTTLILLMVLMVVMTDIGSSRSTGLKSSFSDDHTALGHQSLCFRISSTSVVLQIYQKYWNSFLRFEQAVLMLDCRHSVSLSSVESEAGIPVGCLEPMNRTWIFWQAI
jgi:hypothetical protein